MFVEKNVALLFLLDGHMLQMKLQMQMFASRCFYSQEKMSPALSRKQHRHKSIVFVCRLSCVYKEVFVAAGTLHTPA